MIKRYLILLIILVAGTAKLTAQTEVDERAMISFRKGLGFNAPDSTFGVNIRLRMQNRLAFNLNESLGIDDIEARVSRLRLRFDGYILSPKLTYYLQLSFSRGDQDWDNTHVPNLVRDAMVYYHFTPKFYIGFGQGKLPGNRQRTISSGQQQFYDRSNVNANFTLDRDFGLFGYYKDHMGGVYYNLKGAVSTGDGRNQLKTDKGLMYTARVEVMPFGKFKKDGDFSEGDLEFESTPKISLAAGYSLNQKARRTRGTIGADLYESRDMKSLFADVILKYQGWALFSEYISRGTDNSAFTFHPSDSSLSAYVMTGRGVNTQLSYCFPNYWEIATRYSVVKPDAEINQNAMLDSYYLMGVNKYLRKHLTKFQGFVGYRTQHSYNQAVFGKNNLLLVFQVELGI
ncbi:MAG: OprO/OprP family phosphate-selective porin [Lentimicrobium sp.]|nr:OprO/OprP family phosphate-selective porin [Lentimicrobium sp.]